MGVTVSLESLLETHEKCHSVCYIMKIKISWFSGRYYLRFLRFSIIFCAYLGSPFDHRFVPCDSTTLRKNDTVRHSQTQCQENEIMSQISLNVSGMKILIFEADTGNPRFSEIACRLINPFLAPPPLCVGRSDG